MQYGVWGPFAEAILIPLALAAFASGWKVLGRPGDPTPEDSMFGLDLIVAGAGYQLAVLGGLYRLPSGDPAVDFHIAESWVIFAATFVACFLLTWRLRYVGYQPNPSGVPVLQPRPKRIVNAAGILALFAIFVLNSQAARLYDAWVRYL
jgi:hypothetical protein